MPIRHEEKTFVFMLQIHPVFQYAMIMAEMQGSRRAHAREYALMLRRCSAQKYIPWKLNKFSNTNINGLTNVNKMVLNTGTFNTTSTTIKASNIIKP